MTLNASVPKNTQEIPSFKSTGPVNGSLQSLVTRFDQYGSNLVTNEPQRMISSQIKACEKDINCIHSLVRLKFHTKKYIYDT